MYVCMYIFPCDLRQEDKPDLQHEVYCGEGKLQLVLH